MRGVQLREEEAKAALKLAEVVAFNSESLDSQTVTAVCDAAKDMGGVRSLFGAGVVTGEEVDPADFNDVECKLFAFDLEKNGHPWKINIDWRNEFQPQRASIIKEASMERLRRDIGVDDGEMVRPSQGWDSLSNT